MSRRNESIAIEIGARLGIPAAKVEAAIADALIVRFHATDILAAGNDRGIALTNDQLEAVMDLVVRRFDPDGEGLTWRAIDAAIDEVTGRN